jgi:hypothetical protein
MLTHSISAKPQQRPKNRRLLPLLTNFGCRFIAGDFSFCKFFAKGLKSEGERLKVKFWSSEMVKIGRVSTAIAAVAVATAFRVLQ